MNNKRGNFYKKFPRFLFLFDFFGKIIYYSIDPWACYGFDCRRMVTDARRRLGSAKTEKF